MELMHGHRQELLLFGAGHVGQEVAQRVRGLPFRLTWIDQRPDIFPVDAADHCLQSAADPLAVVAQARTNSVFVVMTHSHQLDLAIVSAALADDRFPYVGLIGSKKKIRTILGNLHASGVSRERLEAVHAPVGLELGAVSPTEIAVSILAELIAVRRGVAVVRPMKLEKSFLDSWLDRDQEKQSSNV